MSVELETEKKFNLEFITFIEEIYIEDYYENNLHLFKRIKTPSCTNSD